MAETPGIRKYEFSADENLTLNHLSKALMKLGVLVLIAGLLFVAYLIVSFIDPPSLMAVSETGHSILSAADYAVWIAISLLIIYLSVMTIRLAGPIRLIANTAGMDISHLMEFVASLIAMARISFASLIVICALILVSMIMMILIF
jgi:hypothetical protein